MNVDTRSFHLSLLREDLDVVHFRLVAALAFHRGQFRLDDEAPLRRKAGRDLLEVAFKQFSRQDPHLRKASWLVEHAVVVARDLAAARVLYGEAAEANLVDFLIQQALFELGQLIKVLIKIEADANPISETLPTLALSERN